MLLCSLMQKQSESHEATIFLNTPHHSPSIHLIHYLVHASTHLSIPSPFISFIYERHRPILYDTKELLCFTCNVHNSSKY